MEQNNSIYVLGIEICLTPLDKRIVNCLTVGDRLSYDYYWGNFPGIQFVLAKPKGKIATPKSLSITARNFEKNTTIPLVYQLPACPAYLRQRLVEKGIYFIVSDKFAFLPNLVINERVRKLTKAERLTPVAQYILLYHLQVMSLNGKSAKVVNDFIPYSYPSIALGLSCLEDLDLLKRKSDGKNKLISFTDKGKMLFEKARQYMIDPVAQRVFCDKLTSAEHFPECSINALAHFSALNPDKERMIAMSRQSLIRLKANKALDGENPYDGDVIIEVWKYPPVTASGYEGQWVDKISLALSLAEDHDPRVEKEVECLISDMQWSD